MIVFAALRYHFPLYLFFVIIYVIIFMVLSFLLSFNVIIFHGQQMLSFLCYHFPLYIFCVIIYVIIWCYHLLLSFPPFFLFPENVTHSFQRLVAKKRGVLFTWCSLPKTWRRVVMLRYFYWYLPAFDIFRLCRKSSEKKREKSKQCKQTWRSA